jgi:hypothetical protein
VRRLQARLLGGRHLNLHFASNRLRDFTLQIQHVAHAAVVVSHPQMTIGSSMNQLRANEHTVARALHRSLDYGVHGYLTSCGRGNA